MKRLRILSIAIICITFTNIASAQNDNSNDFIKVNEITSKGKTLELSKSFHRIGIDSRIEIEFIPTNMLENIGIAPEIYLERDGAIAPIPSGVLADANIFPKIGSAEDHSIQTERLVVSKQDTPQHRIILDFNLRALLKDQGLELNEGDIILIRFTEMPAGNVTYSKRLELVDIGLSRPNQLSLPLMFFHTDINDWELGLGVSGIWHIKTRNGLHNYFGIGLTVTPDQIQLSELKNSRIGLIPTISIGFGEKNPDVFLLGYGLQIGAGDTEGIGFFALNLSWLGNLLR